MYLFGERVRRILTCHRLANHPEGWGGGGGRGLPIFLEALQCDCIRKKDKLICVLLCVL